jgi:hypothetical protein
MHETGKHGVHSDIDVRDNFVRRYNDKMKDMARSIKDILEIDETLAKKTYLEYVGDVAEYYFCTNVECNKVVYSKDHQSRKHVSACVKMHSGVVSKHWKTNSPKVIPVDDFDFNNPEY